MFAKGCLVVILLCFLQLSEQLGYKQSPKSTIDLIRENGYPAERHHVITEDGYILELHRIPSKRKNAPPIYLHHCLLCTSAEWIANGPRKSLGYLLWDEGYDVWLANVRGNTYSRNHTTLSPDTKEFWDFSLDEISRYDLPAGIDFILSKTKQTKISYIGFSMGTAAAFAMFSELPQYNEKINLYVALAPVTSVKNARGPLVELANYFHIVQFLSDWTGVYEVLPGGGLMDWISSIFCHPGFPLFRSLCDNTLMKIIGQHPQNIGKDDKLPKLLLNTPAGTSVKNVAHFMQGKISGKFEKFDYGEKENLKVYGSSTPPRYNIGSTKVPTAVFWAENDWFSTPQDVKQLVSQLPNVIKSKKIPRESFSHLDFVWSPLAEELVYKDVIEILSKMTT